MAGYLDIWLRVVLNLRNSAVPRLAVHGLISVVAHPVVRWALDRKWFAPAAFGLNCIGHLITRKLIYQPFIRPFRHLRRKPRHHRTHLANAPVLPVE